MPSHEPMRLMGAEITISTSESLQPNQYMLVGDSQTVIITMNDTAEMIVVPTRKPRMRWEGE